MFRRLALSVVLAGAVLAAAAHPAAAAPAAWPDLIPLGAGYQPEGIARAGGTRLFVGSIPTGAVSVVDARTGDVDPLVPGGDDRAAIGLEESGGRLFVAGGATGKVFVYDARTGADIGEVPLVEEGTGFINDVTIVNGAAWFTDSRSLTLWRVDVETLEATPLALTGIDLSGGFNLNGIEAGPGGQVLYAVQSDPGVLFAIDPSTGEAAEVVDGLVNGDGLLRQGQTMYVVQNRLNRLAVVDLRAGEIAGTLTSPDFAVPTTVARVGDRLYLPNAKFGTADPDATGYEVVSLRT